MKRALLLTPAFAAIVCFGLGIWNVGGNQFEWCMTGLLLAFISIPGLALIAAEVAS